MKRLFYPVLVLVAILTRSVYIWRAPLWYDENFSLLLARLPFDRMIAATAGDTHPPLWYAVIWLFYHLGVDLPAWCIRIPAMVFGVLALLMFWRVMNELRISPRVRNVAALIFVLSPIQIWYSMEGRMYTLFELEMLAGFWAVLQVRSRWPWLVISMAALLYTQNYGIFYVATLVCSWAVLHLRRPTWKDIRWPLLAAGLALLAWIPWVGIIVNVQMVGIGGSYWIQPITGGYVVGTLGLLLFVNTPLPGISLASTLLFYLWLFFGLYAVLRSRSRIHLTAVLAVFLPLLLAVTASLLWQPILLFRPLIASSPFLYWILALPFDTEKPL